MASHRLNDRVVNSLHFVGCALATEKKTLNKHRIHICPIMIACLITVHFVDSIQDSNSHVHVFSIEYSIIHYEMSGFT